MIKKKTDLTDVTFLIPSRLDSIDRLINLKAIVEFLQKHFETHIHILEADSYNSKLIDIVVSNKVEITFIKDFDPVFFRTYYINQMVNNCKTPLLSVWDTDVIVPPKQIIQSVKWLRANNADFVCPYKKTFLDTSKIIRDIFLDSGDWITLEKHQHKMKQMYTPNPVGGAFFANKETYIESGLENLNFYGWGIEDGERATRWTVLGHEFKRIPGNLYHLTHSRGDNSSFQSPNQREKKIVELNKIRSLTKEELKIEVADWNNHQ
jgi:predicted glycosyltransferase involved in capsule biosynthesis